MRVLFTNEIRRDLLSAINASPNYPVTNLIDSILYLRYQTTTNWDTITVELKTPSIIDSIYLGYLGGVTSISAELYVNAVAQGPSSYFDAFSGGTSASANFTPVENVTAVELSITGSNLFFIGGLAVGSALVLPYPDAAWDDTFTNNSIVVASPHGQVQQQYIEPLRRFTFTFVGVPQDEFTAIRTGLASVGSRPVWVTFFEESPDDFPPGYYSITLGSAQRFRRSYQFSLSFQEAR